ncbi:MAG: HNH endonuclease [Deltaproteobacteria bacterium]|nr:HNH endonuclease [Deltaproteobacteria bacterium]
MSIISFDWDDRDIKRERRRARDLRDTQWWKRKLAKGLCHYCNAAILPKELTMDHIVPLSRGGRSTKGNVVACCKDCNNKKKHLLPMEWEVYLESIQKDSEP